MIDTRAPASSSRIYIKNLPSSLSLEDFRKHFAQQAVITDAKYIPSRRIGYVGYRNDQDAAKAVAYFNKSFLGMSRMKVELARPFDADNHTRPTKRRKTDSSSNKSNRFPDKASSAVDTTSTAQERVRKSTREIAPATLEAIQAVVQPKKQGTWQNDDDELDHAARDLDTLEKGEYPVKDETLATATANREARVSSPVVDASSPVSPSMDIASAGSAVPAEQSLGLKASEKLSDTDWLRSRTSRLLGLVDEDEGEVGKAAEVKPTYVISDATNPVKLNQNQHEDIDPIGSSSEHDSLQTRQLRAATRTQPSTMDNCRLFVRNLSYSTTASDLRDFFTGLGHGHPIEINIPQDSSSGNNKGFAHLTFADAVVAQKVLKTSDQSLLQGRILHVLPGLEQRNRDQDGFELSALPLKTQKHVKQRQAAASMTFNWNSMFMSTDAVVSSVADRMGITKADLLDPSSSDAAVKQALAETHTIQETKNYFTSQGVNLDLLGSKDRGNTCILIKNFPYGTKKEDLRAMIEQHAPARRILMPPAGTIAIAEFATADQTKTVFSQLAYRKFRDSLLFLEKGPKGLLAPQNDATKSSKPSLASLAQESKRALTPAETVETSTLFVSNLNFSTTSQKLHESFASLNGFKSARVKTKVDPKKPGQYLSMGFGFLEFESTEKAEAALSAINGHSLDGHDLVVRASCKGLDATQHHQNKQFSGQAKHSGTKIIIKNLPFEATKKDIWKLFGSYGKLQSVRLPRKGDNSTRGFAFANFTTAREAEKAVIALGSTHLLGRRLVLEVATEDELDPEAEIEKMQKKAGRQQEKVALQKLTGAGRHKFFVEGADDHVDRPS